jgi:hypothetical protein
MGSRRIAFWIWAILVVAVVSINIGGALIHKNEVGLTGDDRAQASAQEKRTLLGEGNASCGEWTRERQKTGLGSELRAWVRGYVTGANADAGTPFLTQTSVDAINIWIDDYCRSKPFEKLAQAVDALVDALHSQAVGRK